jgi:hypothetical protein
LLADKLRTLFGENVFMDVDAIPLGMDFRDVLRVAVRNANVMLVLIGRNWLTSDREGRRKLDDPNDFVRMEIEYALREDISVVPVLIDDATMPKPEQLPASLRRLLTYRSTRFSPRSLESDFQQLQKFLSPKVSGRTQNWKLRLVSALASMLGVQAAATERDGTGLRETVTEVASSRPMPKSSGADRDEVFMSYARDDTSLMQRVRERLARSEISVWTDEKLEPGTASWKKAIEFAIENSPCFIILLTPNAKKSNVVEMELGYALAQERVILPILADGTHRTAVPMEIINRQWTDIREGFETGMERLIQAVVAYRSGEVPDFN